MSLSTRTIADRLMHRRSFHRAMHWDSVLPADLVEQMWRNPDLLLAQGQILQDKPRCTAVRINHPQGPFLFKNYNWGGPIRTLKKSLKPPRLMASWADGRCLHAAGVPTPLPRAYVERRLGPLRGSCYLLTDYIAGTTLYRFMRFKQPGQDVTQQLARQVAAIWQQLHNLCVSHNDLKTENFLVDLAGRVWLIDLEKICRHGNFEEARRRHAEDAARLLHPRNWRTNPAAAEIFRRELLQTEAAKSAFGLCGPAHPLARPAPTVNRPSQLLSVLIPCHNNELVIADCLNSVRDIADEIVVADAGSTDRTLEIVQTFGNCRIVRRINDNEVDFENRAAAIARHAWILRLLPSERLSPDLAMEIQHLLATEPVEDGFNITRRHYYWRKLLRYGKFRHDSAVRLHRQGCARHHLDDGRIELAISSVKTRHLSGKLLYEACWNVSHYLHETTKHSANRGANAAAVRMGPALKAILLRAPWQFFQSYVLRFGFLDGWTGLHAACLSAVSIYLRELRRWDAPMPQSQFSMLEAEKTIKLFAPNSLPDPGAGDGAVSASVDLQATRVAA